MFSCIVIAYHNFTKGVFWFLENSFWWLFLSAPLAYWVEKIARNKEKSDLHQFTFYINVLGSLMIFCLRYLLFSYDSQELALQSIGVFGFFAVNQFMMSFFIVQFHSDLNKNNDSNPELLDS